LGFGLFRLSLKTVFMAMFNPAHPGELIRETIEALREETNIGLTIGEVAKGLGTTRKTLSAIINGKQSVSPVMAIKLAASFQNTTAEFWLRLQDNFDLANARKKINTDNIRVFWKPKAA
jgi:addiction module HigA family antidote